MELDTKVKIRQAVFDTVKFSGFGNIQGRDIDIRKLPKNGYRVTVHCDRMLFNDVGGYLNSCLEHRGVKDNVELYLTEFPIK